MGRCLGNESDLMRVTPSTDTLDANDQDDPLGDPKMADLKPRIASGYQVDAEKVAEAILHKLWLVKSARRELESEPGRSQPGRPHYL